MKNDLTRRQFIQTGISAGMAMTILRNLPVFTETIKRKMSFGLVTYQWGRDWDLPTLIANCEKAGYKGIELRAEHAHKVEISLTPFERTEVKKRFAGSSVKCIGYGSNFEYHSPDPVQLRKNIEQTKEYIKLCKDIGATGIKVKPNDLPEGVPREKTISQIAASLNECGKFGQDCGQLIRVECHGNKTSEIPNMKSIFEQIIEPNVKLCWNCNDEDLLPPGLEENFSSVRRWFGDTIHVRELNEGNYPYQKLFTLLGSTSYNRWVLLEARTEPEDRISAMKHQLTLFNQLIANEG